MCRNTFNLIFICMYCLLMMSSSLPGEDKTIETGDWRFSFNEENGIWQNLFWKEKLVFSNNSKVTPLSAGPNKLLAASNNDIILSSYNFINNEKRLEMNYKTTNFVFTEIITFSPNNAPGLISLNAVITYLPENKSNSPVLLENVYYNFPLQSKADGNVYIPCIGDKPELNLMPLENSGGKQGINGSPLLFEQDVNRTIIFIPDCRKEWHYCRVDKDNDSFCIQEICQGRGWLYPNEPQYFGTANIKIIEKPLLKAFEGGVWEALEEIGYQLPADRPFWMTDVIAIADLKWLDQQCSYTATGNIQAAEQELLPRIKQLGFDALWLMPAWPESTYHPNDYYAIDQRNGTIDDLKSFINKAQKDNIKVFLDIVPHGGTPVFGKFRGDKPWWLIFDKEGNAQDYWCFDFANPEWQNKISDVAGFLMKTYQPDALRIDAPTGSNRENWRKKDFPSIDKVPENVPADWWKDELLNVGGIMPPMPYSRASLSRQSYAGLGMVRSIRKKVKECNNKAGILGEVQKNYDGTESDIIYNSNWFTNFIPKYLPSDTPQDFAKRISIWLEEQKFTDIKDMCRMNCMNYGSCTLNGDWGGINAINAVQAVNFFSKGVPTVNMERDIGYGVLLKKLIEIRKNFPEFRRGDASYLKLNTAQEAVFSVIRNLDKNVSVGIVSFNPERVNLSITIPREYLRYDKVDVWNSWREEPIVTLDASINNKLELELEPFEIGVLTLRNHEKSLPTDFSNINSEETIKRENYNNVLCSFDRWNTPTVTTSVYTAKFRGNGLLYDFRNKLGTRIIDSNNLIYENFLGISPNPAGSIKLKSTDDECVILVGNINYQGAKIELVWKCYSEYIELSTKLQELPKSFENFGYIISLGNATHWQVSTAEGLLDDYYMVRNQYSRPEIDPSRQLYYSASPIIWQSQTRPLSPARPIITSFQKDGSGVMIEYQLPFECGLDNIMLMDKFTHRCNLHLGFMWKQPLVPFEMPYRTKVFSIKITPTSKLLAPLKMNPHYSCSSVQAKNNSRGWQIANRYYKVELRRTGGSIRELANADGKQLVSNVEMFAGEGFGVDQIWDAYGTNSTNNSYISGNDIETSSKFWVEDNKLRLRFYGALRAFGVAYLRMKTPHVYYMVDYTFDDSPTIKVNMSFRYNRSPEGKSDLGINICLPEGIIAKESSSGIDFTEDINQCALLTNITGQPFIHALKKGLRLMVHDNGNGVPMPGKWQTIGYDFQIMHKNISE